jgi:hypothetical protein
MGEPAGVGHDGATAEGIRLAAAQAAVILRAAEQQAEREFRPGHRARFLVWGLALLFGYGTMWLNLRRQHPFHGPNSAAFAAVTLLAAGAGIATALQIRAESGVGGRSAWRQRIHLLALIAGLAGMFALEGGLARAGAGRAVIGVFEAATPIMVAGLLYLAASAVQLDWPVSGLGLWLIAVAAGGAFAGPVGIWAVGALAGGLAFLLMAAIEPWLRAS